MIGAKRRFFLKLCFAEIGREAANVFFKVIFEDIPAAKRPFFFELLAKTLKKTLAGWCQSVET